MQAQFVLEEALDMLSDSGQHHRLRTYVATELASTLGTITQDSIRTKEKSRDEVERDFQRVLDAVANARRLDPTTYNPVDILAWSTLEVARSGVVDNFTSTEAMVDVLDALESVDQDVLDPRNLQQLLRRRLEISTILGDQTLSDAAFESLIAAKSAAGYYIRALDIAGDLQAQTQDRTIHSTRYTDAWAYLDGHRPQISQDPRCLNLLFNYWWQSKTGQRLFERERTRLPFSEEEWLYLLQLVRDIRSLGSYRDLAFAFLEAIALFHLHQVPRAVQQFKELEPDSQHMRGRRRIQKFFLAADRAGMPMTYHGNVRWVNAEGRLGDVYVEELGCAIPFLPMDFGRPGIRRGDSLGEFHTAFSYRGAIADPPNRA